MQRSGFQSKHRYFLVAGCFVGVLIAQCAAADCTPGYKDSVNFHCDPQNSKPALHAVSPRYTAKSNAPQNLRVVQLTCPPGTQSYQGHCVGVAPRPGHAHPHTYTAHSNLTPGITPTYAAKPHRFPPKMIDKSKVKPQPGVPIEHQGHASNTHGIIFVGGKQALNPQPIPPGHAIKRLPHPGTPIEKTGGH